MKKIKIAVVSVLILCLILLPVVANAHGPGRFLFGFGAGLLTGYLFVPRPVYVPPPVYAAPPPVAAPEYVPAPASPPAVREYATDTQAAAGPPPGPQEKCREWRLLDRHLEDRWDSYYGRWRQVPVEKWGWVDVPCK